MELEQQLALTSAVDNKKTIIHAHHVPYQTATKLSILHVHVAACAMQAYLKKKFFNACAML